MSTAGSDDIYGEFSTLYDLYVGDWMEDLPLYLEHAKGIPDPRP